MFLTSTYANPQRYTDPRSPEEFTGAYKALMPDADFKADVHGKRVVIDGLSLATSGCKFACRDLHTHGGGHTNLEHRLHGRFAQRCAAGMADGLAGYHGPACLAGEDGRGSGGGAACSAELSKAAARNGSAELAATPPPELCAV